MKKEEKGITLIALAITIVVLVIISGITISIIVEDDGVIQNTKESRDLTQKESMIQKIEADLYMKKVTDGKMPSKEDLKNIIKENGYANDSDIGNEFFTRTNLGITIYYSEITGWENYIQKGLMLHLDAINNVGQGDNNHSSTTTVWKDLSGNGNDGTLQKFANNSWNTNYLTFDGVDDWVKLGKMNYEKITIEVVMEHITHTNTETDIICNYERAGCGLSIYDPYTYQHTKHGFTIFVNGNYHGALSKSNVQDEKKYILAGNYDGETIKFWENGEKTQTSQKGTMSLPSGTIMALGSNPSGDLADGNFLHGKIYSVRIYNRALTDEEVMNNYEVDKERFDV